MERALKIYLCCLAVPATVLVLWTAWNLRNTRFSILLVAVGLAAAIKATAWSIRRRKLIVLSISGAVLVTTHAVLSVITDEFGSLTVGLVYVLYSASLISSFILGVGLVRALWGSGRVVRGALLAIGGCYSALLVLGTTASIYSTSQAYTSWYFMIPAAALTLDGKHNSGYVHLANAGKYGTDIVVTVRQRWSAETYNVVLPNNGRSSVSERSIAPRLPVFSIGDLIYEPLWTSDRRAHVDPPDRRLVTGPTSVEFTANDGKRVRAEW